MRVANVLLLVTFVDSVVFLQNSHGLQKQKDLTEHVFAAYDPTIRPVRDSSQATDVSFTFWLKQIIDLDEKRQVLTSSAGIKMYWTDEHFHWTPEDYDNITTLWNSSSKVWTPALELWNNAETETFMVDTTVSIHSDSRVVWDALVNVRSFCEIDFFYFPLDDQHCTMKFGPWIMSSAFVNMVVMDGEEELMNDEMYAGEFKVHQVSLDRHVNVWPSGNYSSVVVSIHLRRQPLFYFLNLIIPCVIIFSITLFGFSLPPDSGEKVSLSVTILLSMALFQGLSSELMPPTSSNVPLIAQYNMISMMLVAASTITTIYVLRFWYRGPAHKEVSPWMRKYILGYLFRLLCMSGSFEHVTPGSVPPKREESAYRVLKKKSRNGNLHENRNYETMKLVETRRGVEEHNADGGVWIKQQTTMDPGTQAVLAELQDIATCMRYMASQRMREEQEDDVGKEWKQVALVFNRLFLWIFLILSATTGCYFVAVFSGQT